MQTHHCCRMVRPLAAVSDGVIAFFMQSGQIGFVDVTRDVFTVENRAVKTLDARITLTSAFNQIIQILIHQPIGANELDDFLFRAPMCDKLLGARHIDAIHIRIAHWR